MENITYLLNNYWFEDMGDFLDTLENGERKDKENNLFFENAVDLIKELFEKYKEMEENKEAIFNSIAELYDIIEEWEASEWFILEELAGIQAYAK